MFLSSETSVVVANSSEDNIHFKMSIADLHALLCLSQWLHDPARHMCFIFIDASLVHIFKQYFPHVVIDQFKPGKFKDQLFSCIFSNCDIGLI